MKKFSLLLLTILLVSFGCTSKKKQAKYLDYKVFKEGYAKVSDSLYAAIGETSNKQYREFISYLRENGQTELAAQYNFDTLKWASILFYAMPMMNYYHSHPAYDNYPAVNISHEAAVAYCNWLTVEYEKKPKRKFKKVVFRLPAEDEWELAASGGKENYVYPWGGPFLRNSRGNYLANFSSIRESALKDTVINGIPVFIYTAPSTAQVAGSLADNAMITTLVQSYFPNAIGLYNTAGNVSEMLAEKGHTKGGNWSSTGYYLRIDAEDEFKGQQTEPSPRVGFRVFAEVIEK